MKGEVSELGDFTTPREYLAKLLIGSTAARIPPHANCPAGTTATDSSSVSVYRDLHYGTRVHNSAPDDDSQAFIHHDSI